MMSHAINKSSSCTACSNSTTGKPSQYKVNNINLCDMFKFAIASLKVILRKVTNLNPPKKGTFKRYI